MPWRPTPGVTYDVKLGKRRAHTLRYSFKPASTDWSKRGTLAIEGQDAEVRVPSSDASGDVVFRGTAEALRDRTTEFALICDADGQWRLERIGSRVASLMAQRGEKKQPKQPERSSPRKSSS